MGSKLGSIFGKIGKVAKLAFAGIAAAGAGIFVASIKSAAEFEQAMAAVKAVSGATGKEFEDLTAKAKQLGKDTKFSMTEIASGMESLGRAGFKTQEIIAGMDGVTALASATMTDLGDAAQITATTIRQFGLDASEADRVANVFAATTATSNTTVQSLAESMKYFGPIARTFGIPLEEAAAVVGKLGDAGITGTLATRTLATAMMKLADPTDKMQEVMDRLNLEFFDANGQFVGLNEMVRRLEVGFKDLTPQQKMAAESALFGAQSVKQWNAILAVGSDELDAYTESITGTNAAFEQQEIQLDTLSGQWTILKGSISLLLQTIGEDMMPILKDVLKNTIIPWINGLTTWLEKMGGVRGVVGHALVAIGLYIQAVAEWINAHEFLRKAIDSVWDVLKGIWSFVKDVFRGDWSAAWEEVKQIAKSAADAIVNAVKAAWEALPIPDEIKQEIVDALIAIGDAAKDTFGWIIDHEDIVTSAIAGILGAFVITKISAVTLSLGGVTAALKAMQSALLVLGKGTVIGLAIAAIVLLARRTIEHWDEIKKAGVFKWAGIIGMPTDAQWGKWAKELWDGFLSLLPSNSQWGRWALSILKAIGASFVALGGDINAVGKSIITGIIGGITSGWNTGKAAVWKVITDIIDKFTALGTEAWSWGKNLISGFWNGIKSAWEGVKSAWSNFWGGIIDGVKGIFGIHSPSKEFEGIGSSVGEGFVAGLLAKGKEIEAAGRKLLEVLPTEEEAQKKGEDTGAAYTSGVANGIEAGTSNVIRAEEKFQEDWEASHRKRLENTSVSETQHQENLLRAEETFEQNWEASHVEHLENVSTTQAQHQEKLLRDEEKFEQAWAQSHSDADDSEVEEVKTFWQRVIGEVSQGTTDAAAVIGKWLDDVKNTFSNTFSGIVKDAFKAFASGEPASIPSIVGQGMLDMVSSIFNSGIDRAVGWVTDQLWALVTGAESALSGIGASLGGLGTVLGGLAGAAVPIAIGTGALNGPIHDVNVWLNKLFGQHQAGDTWQQGGQTWHQVPAYATGGVVPGPIGKPQLGVVHGGEVITPPGAASIQVDMRGLYDGATINVRDDQDIRKIARETYTLYKDRMRALGRHV